MRSEGSPEGAEEAVIRVVPRMADFSAATWDALAGGSPFLRHAFLLALETTDCANAMTGWEPMHLALFRGTRLDAAMPLYLKHHSWGEFVFDWAWAETYQRQGLRYYPKLVNCIPFSPVPGPRMPARFATDKTALIEYALALTRDLGLSSFHSLFPDESDQPVLRTAGLLHRTGFQYHWHNEGYATFDDFLAALNHDKRKKIRQERRRLEASGMHFRWIAGPESTPADWDLFHQCYADTYARHRSDPHLTRAFFAQLRETIAEQLVLIVAERHGKAIACSLNLMDDERLYGRYWGAVEYVPGLHFETCYCQSIAFAIAHGLKVFEGGAQGGHKLARGLIPVQTHSWHWLEHAGIRTAVQHFLGREAAAINHHIAELGSPFREG